MNKTKDTTVQKNSTRKVASERKRSSKASARKSERKSVAELQSEAEENLKRRETEASRVRAAVGVQYSDLDVDATISPETLKAMLPVAEVGKSEAHQEIQDKLVGQALAIGLPEPETVINDYNYSVDLEQRDHFLDQAQFLAEFMDTAERELLRAEIHDVGAVKGVPEVYAGRLFKAIVERSARDGEYPYPGLVFSLIYNSFKGEFGPFKDRQVAYEVIRQLQSLFARVLEGSETPDTETATMSFQVEARLKTLVDEAVTKTPHTDQDSWLRQATLEKLEREGFDVARVIGGSSDAATRPKTTRPRRVQRTREALPDPSQPPQAAVNRRDRQLPLRMSSDEAAEVDASVKALGLTRKAWMAQAIEAYMASGQSLPPEDTEPVVRNKSVGMRFDLEVFDLAVAEAAKEGLTRSEWLRQVAHWYLTELDRRKS